ncbi:MAG: hypothetical protein EAZ95_18180 [Bacteroidetes bacterium]|nr:MAG: hypothetical protein EAZ95_18180 [Bacteroidota bacterium]
MNFRVGSWGGESREIGGERIGCWLLVVGCWLLVVGCWLLVSNIKELTSNIKKLTSILIHSFTIHSLTHSQFSFYLYR